MNTMRIGGHTFDPIVNKRAADLLSGRNVDRTWTNVIDEKLTNKQLLDEARDVGAFKGEFTVDLVGENLPKDVQDTWVQAFVENANPFGKKFWSLPGETMNKIGTAIENQSRMVNYLVWRNKGLSPELAAKEVNDALFDYQAITGFEKTLNNTFLPFYTFSKKNLENHIKIFGHRPGAIIQEAFEFELAGLAEFNSAKSGINP